MEGEQNLTEAQKAEKKLKGGIKQAEDYFAQNFDQQKQEEIKNNHVFQVSIVFISILIICGFLSFYGDSRFITQLSVFILALYVGQTIINQVHRGLYTALLILLVIVGSTISIACMIIFSFSDTEERYQPFSVIATIANVFSTASLVSGFCLLFRCVYSFHNFQVKNIEK
ncbi:nad transhydrogenase beta subunit family protein, putative [Ichthyophthirius multifiliis]|uniref:Nad transhydrogenase beta subunit family protein, putative n=1 Tax=Ichthyophthirius multifiliis TaxID=5932 RepID=G0QPE3_ICHMU|nr:nad transhydrogenase beta subunit family protein, putative [Ichthyophthirius multifiliis]EGR32911.1 nad transhydrogenase beta subunit family protein, putative [Ichthyophthirius multifiliis]|eukprot:XP_004036897.1 nad transhydrogenase beta subunit family protein, putative [Ichthyophthirius multifiliis]